MFQKKICGINANCYGVFIKQYLEQNSEFRDEYGIYPIPSIHENKDKEIDINVLKHLDLFIHQDIRIDNAYSEKLSDEYCLKRLKKTCVSICVPNFVGNLKAFYPNIGSKIYKNINGATMFFEDLVIEEAYNNLKKEKNKKLVDVINYVKYYKYDEEELKYNFELMAKKWRKREKNWDIKIVDWIIDNYKDIPLFEDVYHPNDILLNRICKQLLELLNIKDVNYEKVYHMGCAMEIFILPQVKHALGMTWQKEKIRLYNIDYCYHDRQPISYEQYVQEYIWKVFGEILL